MANKNLNPGSSDRVIVIGAGMAGIAMGVQLRRLLGHQNFHIYERFNDVGGTWAQNSYPNLSCDVPSEVESCSHSCDCSGWLLECPLAQGIAS